MLFYPHTSLPYFGPLVLLVLSGVLSIRSCAVLALALCLRLVLLPITVPTAHIGWPQVATLDALLLLTTAVSWLSSRHFGLALEWANRSTSRALRLTEALRERQMMLNRAATEFYTSPKDVFCLRETRIVDGYRCISLFSHKIKVPHVPLREQVQIHMVPNSQKQTMHLRIWWEDPVVQSVTLPLQRFRVHF